jgi:hypothetical protein
MQRVQIMVKTRYNRLLPLLVLAAGCQPEEPEQPEPQAGRTSTEAAQPDAGRQSQGSAEQEPTAQRVALAEISATEGREATGTLQFTAEGDTVRVQGRRPDRAGISPRSTFPPISHPACHRSCS